MWSVRKVGGHVSGHIHARALWHYAGPENAGRVHLFTYGVEESIEKYKFIIHLHILSHYAYIHACMHACMLPTVAFSIMLSCSQIFSIFSTQVPVALRYNHTLVPF